MRSTCLRMSLACLTFPLNSPPCINALHCLLFLILQDSCGQVHVPWWCWNFHHMTHINLLVFVSSWELSCFLTCWWITGPTTKIKNKMSFFNFRTIKLWWTWRHWKWFLFLSFFGPIPSHFSCFHQPINIKLWVI